MQYIYIYIYIHAQYACIYFRIYTCIYVCIYIVKPIYPLNHAAETQSALTYMHKVSTYRVKTNTCIMNKNSTCSMYICIYIYIYIYM